MCYGREVRHIGLVEELHTEARQVEEHRIPEEVEAGNLAAGAGTESLEVDMASPLVEGMVAGIVPEEVGSLVAEAAGNHRVEELRSPAEGVGTPEVVVADSLQVEERRNLAEGEGNHAEEEDILGVEAVGSRLGEVVLEEAVLDMEGSLPGLEEEGSKTFVEDDVCSGGLWWGER